jgi:hypothetical protein
MLLFFPIAWPISLVLDRVPGYEGDRKQYSRRELAAMMDAHGEV